MSTNLLPHRNNMSEEMADSVTEKLVQSIHRINETLMDISEQTFLSVPDIKDVSSSLRARWINEEEMVNTFRLSLKKFQVDEKRKLTNLTDEYSKTRVTVVDKLTEQQALIENEIDKVLEQQVLTETNILNSLKPLNNIPYMDELDEEEPSVHV